MRSGIQGQHPRRPLPQVEDPAPERDKAAAHFDRRSAVPALGRRFVPHPPAQSVPPPMGGGIGRPQAADCVPAGTASPHRPHHPIGQPFPRRGRQIGQTRTQVGF